MGPEFEREKHIGMLHVRAIRLHKRQLTAQNVTALMTNIRTLTLPYSFDFSNNWSSARGKYSPTDAKNPWCFPPHRRSRMGVAGERGEAQSATLLMRSHRIVTDNKGGGREGEPN